MYNIGDIVLINFPFSDFSNFKIRPVLIWKNLGEDFVIMPITTSKINIFGEYFLEKNGLNNLKANSFLKFYNINTVDKNIIKGKLGKISDNDILKVQEIFCLKFCKK